MKKGQMTIYGIIYGFIALLGLVVFAPAYYTLIKSINGNASASGDNFTPFITTMIVPMFGLGILLIPVVYTLAGRGQQEG
jgi:ABC-type phosphate transport system permease subunit